jgi:hypothetical protein
MYRISENKRVSRLKQITVTKNGKEPTSVKRFSLPWGGSDIIWSNSEQDDPRDLIRMGIWR